MLSADDTRRYRVNILMFVFMLDIATSLLLADEIIQPDLQTFLPKICNYFLSFSLNTCSCETVILS